jgi:hypothetical protein
MTSPCPASAAVTRHCGAGEAKEKKPYINPAFEKERVFETMALSCGKVSPTQSQCQFNRKNS